MDVRPPGPEAATGRDAGLFATKGRMLGWTLWRHLQWVLPSPSLDRPIFIIGCGRSGTTILGRVLGQNPRVLFLNEPRRIWALDPVADFWSPNAAQHGWRLALSAQDVERGAALRMRRAFAAKLLLARRRRLLEKVPLNVFRIGYLDRMFPDAFFVHLIRHGIEVATSIAKRPREGWYGVDDSRWHQLARIAEQRDMGELVELCDSDFLRGLLEWRLAVTSSLDSLASLPKRKVLEVRYERFLEDPPGVAADIERFIEVPESTEVRTFAESEVKRPSRLDPLPILDARGKRIVGDVLERLGYGAEDF